MKTVQVGYSRHYNARGCYLHGRDEVLLRFPFGAIDVIAYVGPKPRHSILSLKIGPAEPKDAKARGRVSRGRGYELPSPEIFPADLYTEIVATQTIEVDDDLASAFHRREKAACAEILRRAEARESALITALDYVAGVLGLRLHNLLVRTPITEQRYAFRDKGAPYEFSVNLRVNVTATYDWDVSDEGLKATNSRILTLQNQWKKEKAAEVLAWLLRAWAAEDPVLEFVSLFIPLECVIPELPIGGKDAWDQKRRTLLTIIIKKEAAARDRNELLKFLSDLLPPPPPLASRFKKWATDAALPEWKHDIVAFTLFNKMRNSLFHAGNKRVKSLITIAADDVRTLEDIAARYVSLALFGDANVYKSRGTPTRF